MIIYPNPASGLFTISLDNQLFGSVIISIIDQAGKEIIIFKSEKTSDHFEKQVDMRSYGKGIYFISLKMNSQVSNKKIIIK